MTTTVHAPLGTAQPSPTKSSPAQSNPGQPSAEKSNPRQPSAEKPSPEKSNPAQPGPGQPSTWQLSTQQLAETARTLAARPGEWISRVRLNADGRWYEQIHAGDGYDVWLITWLPGQSTGFHDHGGSAGAFALAWGVLEEHRLDTSVVIGAGQAREIEPDIVHDVRNNSAAPAVSVHAYSPPLAGMTRYDITGDGLVAGRRESSRDW